MLETLFLLLLRFLLLLLRLVLATVSNQSFLWTKGLCGPVNYHLPQRCAKTQSTLLKNNFLKKKKFGVAGVPRKRKIRVKFWKSFGLLLPQTTHRSKMAMIYEQLQSTVEIKSTVSWHTSEGGGSWPGRITLWCCVHPGISMLLHIQAFVNKNERELKKGIFRRRGHFCTRRPYKTCSNRVFTHIDLFFLIGLRVQDISERLWSDILWYRALCNKVIPASNYRTL